MIPIQDLLAQAAAIKNETVENNNSANRVGAWMEEVIPYLEDIADKAESGGSEKTLKTVEEEIVQLAGRIPHMKGISKLADATLVPDQNISILNTVVSATTVKHYTMPVLKGQLYYFSTQIGTNTLAAAAILKGIDGKIVHYQSVGIASGYTTIKDAPFYCDADGTLIINALTSAAVQINAAEEIPPIIEDLEMNKASTDVLQTIKIGISSKGADAIANGVLIPDEARSIYNAVIASTSWKLYKFQVNEGDLIFYSTRIGTNTNVATAMLIDADGIVVNYQNKGVSTGNTTVADEPFYCRKSGELIINALSTYIVKVNYSQYNSSQVSIGKNLNVNIANNVVNINVLGHDITFQNGGSNNLFDLNTIAMGATSLLARVTDFMTAYQIDAVLNADGDARTDLNVGGNHAFFTTSGTPTGRQISVIFLVDSNQLTTFAGFASIVKIIVVNRIQATNTVKEDGTGREVLEEKYTFNIHADYNNIVVDITRTFTALEDIIMKRAFLCSLSGAQMTTGRFLTSNTLAPFDATLSETMLPTGNLDNSIMLKNASEHTIISEIDVTKGYGRMRKNNSNSMLSYYSSRKAYHALVNALDLSMTGGDTVTGYGRLIIGTDLV